ncbi:mannose-6-phosphate isomerase [Bacteroidia bacterium]|nr:mannose-6-phosphate isomerase [Bacteroidia bacterium]
MIWGGSQLRERLGKAIPSDKTGESWELSGVADNVSVVSNGEYAGCTLDEWIALAPEQTLGKKNVARTGSAFPLLIKFIDACDNLSVQVHPNDEQARPFNSLGKTEMWYILNAQQGATLISGFAQDVSAQEYAKAVENNTLEQILQHHPVQRGDVFFIPAGRVHAIGKGILLLEIQQSSNITYRIFDYNRKDAQGNSRELHTRQAMQVIDYKAQHPAQSTASPAINQPANLAACKYFTTNLLKIDQPTQRDNSVHQSFVVYIGTQGSTQIEYAAGKFETLNEGETILLPAALAHVQLAPNAGLAEVVEVYV